MCHSRRRAAAASQDSSSIYHIYITKTPLQHTHTHTHSQAGRHTDTLSHLPSLYTEQNEEQAASYREEREVEKEKKITLVP